ncbi:MAG: hypothetical protein ACE5F7_08635 [Nitrospiria bacterium]
MTVKKALTGLILVSVFVGVGAFFNQPQERPFPFSRPLEFLPDYRPPGEGVTLYPTGGPFGFDVIETITTGKDGAIYVGTFGGGLFKSRDQGGSWRPINRGLRDKFISTLFFLDDGRLFAGTIRAGLFMSEDQGEHWVSANKGLERTDVTTIIALPSGDLLAGTGKGVYLSRDGGTVWKAFNTGLDHTQIQSLAAAADQTLYAGTQGLGIFKRDPNGKEWYSIASGFAFKGLEERVVRALVLGRNEMLFAGTMAAGIFRSADGGRTWENANAGLNNLSIRTLKMDGAGMLYAGTGEGVYYSDNDGVNWMPLFQGMENIQIHSMEAHPSGDLYVGSSSGLYFGTISKPWRSLHDQLLISPILSLSYAKDRITAGTEGKGTYVNQDDNWMSDNLGLVNLTIRALSRGKVFVYAITNDGVYRRQVGRHQWGLVNDPSKGEAMSVAVDDLDHVYLGMSDGLYFSEDYGENWARVSAVDAQNIEALSASGQRLFAASQNQIWTKAPEGAWEKVITKEGSPFQLILWRPNKGLLAVSDQKIWERDLQGVWRELKGDLPSGVEILSIAVDPHNSNILYLGTAQGLLWSKDNGKTWQPANLYDGAAFKGKIHQVLPTDSSAVWLATDADGVVLGISKDARRNFLDKSLAALEAVKRAIGAHFES